VVLSQKIKMAAFLIGLAFLGHRDVRRNITSKPLIVSQTLLLSFGKNEFINQKHSAIQHLQCIFFHDKESLKKPVGQRVHSETESHREATFSLKIFTPVCPRQLDNRKILLSIPTHVLILLLFFLV